MSRKTLAEAAKEILSERQLRPADATGEGESIGAGVHTTKLDHSQDVTQSAPSAKALLPKDTRDAGEVRGAGVHTTKLDDPSEGGAGHDADLGGPVVSLGDTGIGKASGVTEEDDKDEDEDDDDKEDDKDDDADDDKDDEKNEELGLDDSPLSVSDKVKSYVKGKKAGLAVEADLKALFSGENLSENFMAKAKVIFETALISRATQVCEEIEDEYISIIEDHTNKITQELTEKVDDYLNYMVEEWVKENEIAIEQSIRSELSEEFISGLRNLFIEHYIDIPEDKINVVEELSSKVEELEEKINEEVQRGISASKELKFYKARELVNTVSEGLTETQYDKFLALTENVEFVNEAEYLKAVTVIRESYFGEHGSPKVESKKQLDEESAEGDPLGVEEEEVSGDPEIDAYAKHLSKSFGKFTKAHTK